MRKCQTLLAALLIVPMVQTASAALIFAEADYLAEINTNFSIDIGRDASGTPFSSIFTTQVVGSNIYSDGIGVTFSSPDAPDSSLVSVHAGIPELGPVSATGDDWGGALRVDFSETVLGFGFGLNSGLPTVVSIFDNMGHLISSETVTSASFIGIVDQGGFSTVLLDTDHEFWSIDSASSALIYGEKLVAPVPVPAALWLFGSGLIGLAAFSRRKA